jgi:hypothetical protein
MNAKTIKFKIGGSEELLCVEQYQSIQEMVSLCTQRTSRFTLNKNNDIFHKSDDWPCDRPKWRNFRTIKDLKERLAGGLKDTSVVQNVQRYAAKAQTAKVDKLAQMSRRVSGGSVDINRFLNGVPECMWTLTHKKVASRVIYLDIELSVTCDNEPEVFQQAGESICRVIAKLEKAGYRIRLHVSVLIYCDWGEYGPKGNSSVMLDIPIKRENESMNFRRILYPLTDISFFRGAVFGWLATCPDMRHNDTFGRPLVHALRSSERDETLDRIYKEVYGHECIHLHLAQLVSRLIEGESQEQMEKNIEAQLLSTE